MALENNQMGLVPLVQQVIQLNSFNFLYINSTLESFSSNLASLQNSVEDYKPLATNVAFYGAFIGSFATTNFVTNLAYSALFVPTLITTIIPAPVTATLAVGYLATNLAISYQVGTTISTVTERVMDRLCSVISANEEVEGPQITYEATIEEDYWDDLEPWSIVEAIVNYANGTNDEDDYDSSVSSEDSFHTCYEEEWVDITPESSGWADFLLGNIFVS